MAHIWWYPANSWEFSRTLNFTIPKVTVDSVVGVGDWQSKLKYWAINLLSSWIFVMNVSSLFVLLPLQQMLQYCSIHANTTKMPHFLFSFFKKISLGIYQKYKDKTITLFYFFIRWALLSMKFQSPVEISLFFSRNFGTLCTLEQNWNLSSRVVFSSWLHFWLNDFWNKALVVTSTLKRLDAGNGSQNWTRHW